MNEKELLNKLKDIKKFEDAGQPQESWVLSNKEILMSQIKPQTVQAEPQERIGESVYYFKYFNELFSQKVLKPVTVSLMVVAMLLTYSATVSVASASLPGDMLYPVKTTKERLQLALTFNEEDKIMLQLDFVIRRVDEFQKLAWKDDDDTTKAQKLSQSAKQISQDVIVVKDNLNRITMAASIGALELAKQVDDKTIEVKQDITQIQNQLSDQVKGEVASDIKEAIGNTEATGVVAIGVIIDQGEGIVSNEDTAGRLAERIKLVEIDLAKTAEAIANSATSTATIIQPSSEVISGWSANLQDARKAIAEAKDLLSQGKFNLVLDKIKVSQDIISQIKNEIAPLAGSVKVITTTKDVDMSGTKGQIMGTSTAVILNNTNVIKTTSTTEETSESTRNIL